MNVAVMQPYFFPYLGYWQLISASNVFILFDDVYYSKKGYVDRNTIAINNERRHFKLTISGASKNNLINELEIKESPSKLLKTIEMAYGSARHFDAAFPLFKDILEHDERKLSRFLKYSIEKVNDFLGISKPVMFSSSLECDERGAQKIIPLVKHHSGQVYINMEGGRALYDVTEFHDNGISLHFLTPDDSFIVQRRGLNLGRLSIIDTLMHFSVGELRPFIDAPIHEKVTPRPY